MSGNQNMAGDKNQRDVDRGTSNGEGDMSVREAGHLGGEKGGQRVRELIEEGREAERKHGDRD